MTALPSVPKPIASVAQSVPDRFPACLAFTWRQENDGQPYHVTPGDHGGATAWGVTIAAFQHWRLSQGKPCPTTADLKLASKDELGEIARCNYWNPVLASSLPAGVDLLVYEFGFGSGPVTSVLALQRTVNTLGAKLAVDGQIGPMTLAAAGRVDRHTLIGSLGAAHAAFYQSLGQPVFVRGWLRRNTDRVRVALAG